MVQSEVDDVREVQMLPQGESESQTRSWVVRSNMLQPEAFTRNRLTAAEIVDGTQPNGERNVLDDKCRAQNLNEYRNGAGSRRSLKYSFATTNQTTITDTPTEGLAWK